MYLGELYLKAKAARVKHLRMEHLKAFFEVTHPEYRLPIIGCIPIEWFQLGTGTGNGSADWRYFMEDIRPKGAWYAVWLTRADDNGRPGGCNPVVDVQKLADCLPHGSGIDGNWTIHICRNGDITCHGEFHAMNENGYYCGWKNFRFSIRKHRGKDKVQPLCGPCAGQVQIIRVKGRVYLDHVIGGGDANDYLSDTCYWAVSKALGIRSME